MSEAKKLATVFRAAADGIAKGVMPREAHAEYVKQAARAAERGDPWNYPPGTYQEYVRRLLLPGTHSREGDPYRLGQFDAFNSIADLFEKVVEAEGAS